MLPNVGKIAALMGHPVRSSMLFSLLDGGELPASELAARGGASPTAASAHLAKLVSGGLLCVRDQGRRRFFRLSSAEIAHAIETLAAIAPASTVKSLDQHSMMQRLRRARTCYDHLAGRLGVEVTEALTRRQLLSAGPDEFAVTRAGEAFFRDLGIELDPLRGRHRAFSRVCLDWTERRHHIAGALGAALLDACVQREWVIRNTADRALRISPEGERSMPSVFGFQLAW